MSLARLTSSAITSTADVLAWCEQGHRALQDAASVAESKGLLDIASTLEHAVKLRDLNAEAAIAASTLRVLAERRVGEMIRAEQEAGKLATRETGRPRLQAVPESVDPADTYPATLADHGITRDQASEFKKLAAAPQERFEAAVEKVKSERTSSFPNVTRAAVLREIDPEGEKRPTERHLEFDRFITSCERALDLAPQALVAWRFGFASADHPWPEAQLHVAQRAVTGLRDALTEFAKELNR